MRLSEKYRPQFTYEDWMMWEGRWELIDGMPYSVRPYVDHQKVNGNLLFIFDDFFGKNCEDCEMYMPLSWIINERNIVQPDMLVLDKKIEKKNSYLDFTPTLVAEILSTATADKDRHEKFELYEHEGVKYYLLIDPQSNQIEIYELQGKKYKLSEIHPNQFRFIIKENRHFSVNFDNIWE